MDPAERAALAATLAEQTRRAERLIDEVEEAAAASVPLDPAEWRGPAGDAFRAAERRMRQRQVGARTSAAGLAGGLRRARAAVGG